MVSIVKPRSQQRLIRLTSLAWVFSAFLQGVAGFGVPIAVVAPLLLGLGFDRFSVSPYLVPEIKGVSPYIVMLIVLFVRPEGLVPQTFQKKV